MLVTRAGRMETGRFPRVCWLASLAWASQANLFSKCQGNERCCLTEKRNCTWGMTSRAVSCPKCVCGPVERTDTHIAFFNGSLLIRQNMTLAMVVKDQMESISIGLEGQACLGEKENPWGFPKQEDFNPHSLRYGLIQCAPNCPHNTFCDFLPSRVPRHTSFVLVPDKESPSRPVVLSTGWGSCGNSKHKRQIEAWINYLGASALEIVIITGGAFQQGHVSVLQGLLAASPALPWLWPSEPV